MEIHTGMKRVVSIRFICSFLQYRCTTEDGADNRGGDS